MVARPIDRGSATNRTSVIDQDIEATKVIECLLDDLFCRLRLSKIPGYWKSHSAGAFYSAARLLG